MKSNEKFDFQIKWHTFILLKSLKDTGFIKVCSFVRYNRKVTQFEKFESKTTKTEKQITI
jgi:hypothetical protein